VTCLFHQYAKRGRKGHWRWSSAGRPFISDRRLNILKHLAVHVVATDW